MNYLARKTIFDANSWYAITAIMAIFIILAIMANLVMAINMAIMGVLLKKSKNADLT